MPTRIDARERFLDWSIPEPNTGCHLWLGDVTNSGYGRFWLNGKNVSAHRIAYEFEHGPIPEGMQIDHLCNTKICVNVRHLRLTTATENLFAAHSNSTARKFSTRSHCSSGHEYTAANTYFHGKHRHCRECNKQRMRQHRLRRT